MIQPYSVGVTISKDLLREDPYGVLAPPPPKQPGLWGRLLCAVLGHDWWYPVFTSPLFDRRVLVDRDHGKCMRCGTKLERET